MVEEKAEAGVAELVAVTLQVVAAELVDDDDYYQLGMRIVGRGGTADRCANQRRLGNAQQRGRGARQPIWGTISSRGSLHRRGEILQKDQGLEKR